MDSGNYNICFIRWRCMRCDITHTPKKKKRKITQLEEKRNEEKRCLQIFSIALLRQIGLSSFFLHPDSNIYIFGYIRCIKFSCCTSFHSFYSLSLCHSCDSVSPVMYGSEFSVCVKKITFLVIFETRWTHAKMH